MRHGIAGADRQIGLLIAGVEAQPQPKAIGQRQMIIGGIARINGIRLIFRKAARYQMAAVAGNDQAHMIGPRLHSAIEQRAQRMHLGGIGAQRHIIKEDQKRPLYPGQCAEQCGQTGQRRQHHLHQRDIMAAGHQIGDHAAGQAGFSHAARAPQQDIVGRQTQCMTAAVLVQLRGLGLHTFVQCQRRRAGRRQGGEAPGIFCAIPAKPAAVSRIGGCGRRRRHPVERGGNAGEQGVLSVHAASTSQKRGCKELASVAQAGPSG